MRKSCSIAAFLMLSTLKNEKGSQNFFVFDVVNFENEEVSQRERERDRDRKIER